MTEAPSAPRSGLAGFSWRQITALVALLNALVATYLHLWKIGKVGTLACISGHGCAIVQGSQWSYFFTKGSALGQYVSVDVALIGAVGYSALFLVAAVGTWERFAESRWPALVMLALVNAAFLFTLRLKWAEFYKLRTFCPWCAISAISITCLMFVVWAEWRRVRNGAKL